MAPGPSDAALVDARSRRHRHRCHRHRRLPCSHRHTRPRRRAVAVAVAVARLVSSIAATRSASTRRRAHRIVETEGASTVTDSTRPRRRGGIAVANFLSVQRAHQLPGPSPPHTPHSSVYKQERKRRPCWRPCRSCRPSRPCTAEHLVDARSVVVLSRLVVVRGRSHPYNRRQDLQNRRHRTCPRRRIRC